ncbi:nitronate monooxygenase [Salinibacterium sp. ZJ454]|uniref:NAD(P)H-dependent flavin oxidoreductase n=1 Tax=Salinibacterium sp. ZJ454 TaxID=2708339 RepID=UPI00141E062D|nr:nitronate monooxygenase [Salinibacterium sp. ZJ454]
MLTTRITELLQIEKPIVQGGMQWIGYAELAAAVSNAGGLGLMTALSHATPEIFYDEIRRCQTLTDEPFGINLTTLPSITPPPYRAYLDAAISAGVQVVETSGSNPAIYTPILKEAGITVLHKATSLRHARKAEEVGVDAVIVDGFECAGHPGENDIPGLIAFPAAAETISIPILAAGGVADGRGLAAALALGADGVLIATRLMATTEAGIHENVKQAIVDADELQTNLIFRELRNTARVAKNSISDEVVAILRNGGVFEDVRHLVSGARGRTVYETGDLEAGIWWAGLAQTLIHDVPSCAELLTRIVEDAESVIRWRLAGLITTPADTVAVGTVPVG